MEVTPGMAQLLEELPLAGPLYRRLPIRSDPARSPCLHSPSGPSCSRKYPHNHVEKAHGVPPTFELIQVQRPFMSLGFAPSVILPDGTTPVALDPGALDVIRPCSGS